MKRIIQVNKGADLDADNNAPVPYCSFHFKFDNYASDKECHWGENCRRSHKGSLNPCRNILAQIQNAIKQATTDKTTTIQVLSTEDAYNACLECSGHKVCIYLHDPEKIIEWIEARDLCNNIKNCTNQACRFGHWDNVKRLTV